MLIGYDAAFCNIFENYTERLNMEENNFNYPRTEIAGETAIKPYYYIRNNLIHVRYNVDRAIELSNTESAKVKVDLTLDPAHKQEILAKAWNLFEVMVKKPVIKDGIKESEKKGYFGQKNGYKN